MKKLEDAVCRELAESMQKALFEVYDSLIKSGVSSTVAHNLFLLSTKQEGKLSPEIIEKLLASFED